MSLVAILLEKHLLNVTQIPEVFDYTPDPFETQDNGTVVYLKSYKHEL